MTAEPFSVQFLWNGDERRVVMRGPSPETLSETPTKGPRNPRARTTEEPYIERETRLPSALAHSGLTPYRGGEMLCCHRRQLGGACPVGLTTLSAAAPPDPALSEVRHQSHGRPQGVPAACGPPWPPPTPTRPSMNSSRSCAAMRGAGSGPDAALSARWRSPCAGCTASAGRVRTAECAPNCPPCWHSFSSASSRPPSRRRTAAPCGSVLAGGLGTQTRGSVNASE